MCLRDVKEDSVLKVGFLAPGRQLGGISAVPGCSVHYVHRCHTSTFEEKPLLTCMFLTEANFQSPVWIYMWLWPSETCISPLETHVTLAAWCLYISTGCCLSYWSLSKWLGWTPALLSIRWGWEGVGPSGMVKGSLLVEPEEPGKSTVWGEVKTLWVF